jgi:hypothetical protein
MKEAVTFSEGSFLNEFLRLCKEKLAPNRKVGACTSVGFGSVCA